MGFRFPLAATPAVLAILALAGCLGAPAGRSDPVTLSCDPCGLDVPAAFAHPFEVDIAVDPNDPRHIVVAAVEMTHVYDPRETALAREFVTWITIHATFDGGATWASMRMPGGPSEGPTHPLATSNHMTDATVTITEGGTVLVAGMGMPRHTYRLGPTAGPATEVDIAPPAKIFVARSFDGGLSFRDVQVVHEGIGAGVPGFGPIWQDGPDKPWIRAVGDEAMLAFTLISLPGIIDGPDLFTFKVVATTSRDEGASWAPLQTLAGPSHEIAYPMRSDNGDWLVKFLQIPGGLQVVLEGMEANVMLAWARPDGEWEVATGPATLFGTSALWSGAVVGQGDGERVLLPHGVATPEGIAIVVESTADRGRTWDEPVVLDVLPEGAFPIGNAAAAPDGTLYVMYLAWDRAATPTVEDPGVYEIRLAALRGSTVYGPIVLEGGLDGGPSYRGHYNGVAPTADGAVVVWTGGPADALVHRVGHVRLA